MSAPTRRSTIAGLAATILTSSGLGAEAMKRDGSIGEWVFGASAPAWRPLELAVGDALLVPATVAGVPVLGILDSGSGASVVSDALAVRLGLRAEERRTVSGLSGKAEIRLARDVPLGLAGDVRRLPFVIVADLRVVSAAFGRPVELMIGADVMEGRAVALDLAERRFAVAPTGEFKSTPDWKATSLAHGSRRELYIHASVSGLPLAPLMLDLGNSAALMLSSRYVAANALARCRRVSTAALGGLEGARLVDVFVTDAVELGGLNVGHIPTIGMSNWASDDTVGSVGLPLVMQFDAVLDVTAGYLWLRPLPPHRRREMLKDRSGLGVAASSDRLTVVHVARGGPAAAANWIVGEQIIGINGRAIDAQYTRGSLWRWRYAPAGTLVGLMTGTGQRHLVLDDYY